MEERGPFFSTTTMRSQTFRHFHAVSHIFDRTHVITRLLFYDMYPFLQISILLNINCIFKLPILRQMQENGKNIC